MQSETTLHALALERERDAQELEVGQLRLEREHTLRRIELDGELALARSRVESAHAAALLDLERDHVRASIDNDQSPAAIQARLIESLPEIAARLPKPAELRSVTIGGTGAGTITGLIAELTAVVGALRSAADGPRPD